MNNMVLRCLCVLTRTLHQSAHSGKKNYMNPLKPKLLPFALIVMALALQSCSHAVKPDLKRLYEQSRTVRQPPVILIHGMMGSRLSDSNSGKEVWVGKLSNLVFSNYENIALEIDPDSLLPKPSPLVTSGLLDTVVGTPNLGSVGALHSFIDGVKIGARTIPTETVATMPSAYQLFPHALNDWIVTSSGKPLDRDLFDVRIWRAFQWSIFDPLVRARIMKNYENEADGLAYLDLLERYFEKHLERARRFVWSLTVPLPAQPYKLIVLGGDCALTPARIVVEEAEGVSEVRLWPDKIKNPVATVNYDRIMLEPGDGTVTKSSLLARESLDPSVPRHKWISFPLDYPIFLCESHTSLTGNITFQNALLHTLLSLDMND